MRYVRQMLDTYPRPPAVDAGLLAAAIEAASDCAQACTADTDADLGEQNLAEMVKCIRLCLDCADICTAIAGVLSRPAEFDANATRLLLGPARPSARAAAMSASGMPICRIAGSARRPAAAAIAPAGTCWTPGNSRPVSTLRRQAGSGLSMAGCG
jgi:hypothetical protein